jgi:4-diphosphocytidyl-2-C-methyl-D-erythritol kinase
MTSLPLRALAPAKINLGLFLGSVRADGRHEVVTVMQSIALADELTLREAPSGSVGDEVLCPGLGDPPPPPEENLAARALAAFRAATGWQAPPLQLSILKRVPVAAGMGGGSGDAAAALRLAACASGLGDRALLDELARGLGADVPAQVQPGRWLASGAGELLHALPDPLAQSGRSESGRQATFDRAGAHSSESWVGGAQPEKLGRATLGVLVLPLAHALSTAQVYAQADRMGRARGRAELEERHRALGRALAGGAPLPPAELLHNDLQDAARALCPEIDAALAQARGAQADVAVLSGSGPTVLGLFGGPEGPRRARAAARVLEGRAPAPIAAEPVAAGFAQAAGLTVGHN